MRSIKKQIILISLFFFTFVSLYVAPACAITIKEEEELSKIFLKSVFKSFKVIDDPVLTNYVNKVGNKIVSTLPEQPFKFHFYMIEAPTINAFAGPAGHIFINSGLLKAMKNEDELAGIIGHEIAHVTCRHISYRIDRSKKIQMGTIAGMLAGIALATTSNGEAGSAVITSTMAAGQTANLAYSREDEMQADQIGLQYLENAGFSGEGLVNSLTAIRKNQWFDSKKIPDYLLTHPAVDDRIAYLKGRIKPAVLETTTNSPSEFDYVQTKLIGQYENVDIAQKTFEAALKKDPNDMIAYYGLGLVADRKGNRIDAVSHIQTALKKDIFNTQLRKDLGRVCFQAGNYTKAVRILSNVFYDEEYDQKAGFYLGRSLAELGRYKEASDVFREIILKSPDYTDAKYFLGECLGKDGQLGKAHFYLGSYYKDKHDRKNTRFHLNKAKKLLKDPILLEKAKELLDGKTEKDKDSDRSKETGQSATLKLNVLGVRALQIGP